MEKDVNYYAVTMTANLDFNENLDTNDKSIYSIKTHLVLINKLFES